MHICEYACLHVFSFVYLFRNKYIRVNKSNLYLMMYTYLRYISICIPCVFMYLYLYTSTHGSISV